MAKIGKQGEGGGQPPKYKTEDLLLEKVEEYFDNLEEREIPQKAGLLLTLDICRSVYAEYKKKYPNTISYAEHQIEKAWVERLSLPGTMVILLSSRALASCLA